MTSNVFGDLSPLSLKAYERGDALNIQKILRKISEIKFRVLCLSADYAKKERKKERREERKEGRKEESEIKIRSPRKGGIRGSPNSGNNGRRRRSIFHGAPPYYTDSFMHSTFACVASG